MTNEIDALVERLREPLTSHSRNCGATVGPRTCAICQAADALISLSRRVKELEEGLQMLVDAADSFQDAATAYFTDSTYDGDGVLADTQSTLDVLALPVARAILQKDKA